MLDMQVQLAKPARERYMTPEELKALEAALVRGPEDALRLLECKIASLGALLRRAEAEDPSDEEYDRYAKMADVRQILVLWQDRLIGGATTKILEEIQGCIRVATYEPPASASA